LIDNLLIFDDRTKRIGELEIGVGDESGKFFSIMIITCKLRIWTDGVGNLEIGGFESGNYLT